MRRLVVLLLVLPALIGEARAADSGASADALLEWRAWAERALEAPPGEIRRFEGLAERLRELITERRREAADLAPLEPDPGLQRAADAYAIDLLRRDFMAHETPDGLTVGDRVALLARQFVGIAGENLAEHEGLTPDQLQAQTGPLALKIVDGWMASPGHRENIVRPDYTHDAISAFVQDDRLVMVHVFGARTTRLQRPVALEQASGGALGLAFDPGASGSAPERYAYRAHGQPVADLVVLELTSDEVVVDPGLYQLMFLFPGEQANSFDVADGPWIQVR